MQQVGLPEIRAEAAPKPSQRVRLYMQECYSRIGAGQSYRLATTRELANRLGVSPRTVHKVYLEYAARGLVHARPGRGSILLKPRSSGGGKTCILGLMGGPPRKGRVTWSSEITAGILHAGAESGLNLSLQTVSTYPEDRLESRLLEVMPRIDGFILFPFPGVVDVMNQFNLAEKSAVCLNPPSEESTANFVSPSYYLSSHRIGAAWKAAQRKKILFVSGSVRKSVSTRLRLAGLCAGLGTHLTDVTALKLLELPGPDLASAHERLKAWFEATHWRPDAVYCAGDYQALALYRLLQELSCAVPEEVSIVGGTGYDLSHSLFPGLTRMGQSLHALGVELFRMFERRYRSGGMDVPGHYVEAPFIGLGSTTEKENAHLNGDAPPVNGKTGRLTGRQEPAAKGP